MPKPSSKSTGRKITFIVSDEKNPKVALKPGTKLEVVSVKLADTSLKQAAPVGARLCGGSNTCITLVEI